MVSSSRKNSLVLSTVFLASLSSALPNPAPEPATNILRRPSQTAVCVNSCPTVTVTTTVQPTGTPLKCVPFICLRIPCKKATTTVTYPTTCPPASTITSTVTASCTGCNACTTTTVSVAGLCSATAVVSAH